MSSLRQPIKVPCLDHGSPTRPTIRHKLLEVVRLDIVAEVAHVDPALLLGAPGRLAGINLTTSGRDRGSAIHGRRSVCRHLCFRHDLFGFFSNKLLSASFQLRSVQIPLLPVAAGALDGSARRRSMCPSDDPKGPQLAARAVFLLHFSELFFL
ncbi:hypothetical protein FA10DRAFT_78182 [Acaromyces ingoldii]|uniref:Uncharacterized protein n=1 Tax=Acaromyces ingoldii TaxID=215250 RepID=A0A316YSC8_9BASI|nr:hypothetical protein FA10DRAFT_78182 [Acaromyces ingoldii]PWN91926.1 hypothetical protein FA10DRAFT_78182 [Acaromyces ingoldii]